MRELLTPKQVARAIQVSESSVKRWCDKGAIPTRYTAGGHRRIPLSGLMQFLRATKHELIAPEVIGLPATSGRTGRVIARAREQMIEVAETRWATLKEIKILDPSLQLAKLVEPAVKIVKKRYVHLLKTV